MAGSTPALLSAEAPVAEAAKDKAQRFSPTHEAWRRFRRHKLAVVSAVILLLIYLVRDGLKAVLGPEGGVFVMIVIVIGGLRWMPVARLVRAQILSIREKEFVEAARALGASRLRIVANHILPNALGPVIVAG